MAFERNRAILSVIAGIVTAAVIIISVTAAGLPTHTIVEVPTTSTVTMTQTTTSTVTTTTKISPGVMGTLILQITDKPPRNLTYLYIEIDEISLHRQGNESGIGPKVNFPVDAEVYNVTALQGINEILGANSVPDGNYTMIELHILSANATFSDNLDDNVTLTIVANGWMKIPVHFRISEGDVTVVTLDFDIEQTQVSASDVLRPVIKPRVDKEPKGD